MSRLSSRGLSAQLYFQQSGKKGALDTTPIRASETQASTMFGVELQEPAERLYYRGQKEHSSSSSSGTTAARLVPVGRSKSRSADTTTSLKDTSGGGVESRLNRDYDNSLAPGSEVSAPRNILAIVALRRKGCRWKQKGPPRRWQKMPGMLVLDAGTHMTFQEIFVVFVLPFLFIDRVNHPSTTFRQHHHLSSEFASVTTADTHR